MTNPSPSNPELLPCPFCGGTDIGLADNTGPKLCTAPHAYAWCRNAKCFASGNESDTVAEAITAWNQRSNLPSNCPSCHGLNISCPDGCGRDPLTGELNGTRLVLPSDGAVGELVEQFKALAECVEDRNFSNEVLGICLRARWADLTTTLTRLAAGREADAKRIEVLEGALTPSGYTKAAYHGEFHFQRTVLDDNGDEYSERIYVPWTTTKEIMAAIRAYVARQALSPTPGKDG